MKTGPWSVRATCRLLMWWLYGNFILDHLHKRNETFSVILYSRGALSPELMNVTYWNKYIKYIVQFYCRHTKFTILLFPVGIHTLFRIPILCLCITMNKKIGCVIRDSIGSLIFSTYRIGNKPVTYLCSHPRLWYLAKHNIVFLSSIIISIIIINIVILGNKLGLYRSCYHCFIYFV